MTILLFAGLTATAVMTRIDFSFLGPILAIGGFVALGVIVISIVFGFNLGLFFSAVIKESLITAADGKPYKTELYRLEVIIAIGYRVKSHRGTQFRQSAMKLRKLIIENYKSFQFPTEIQFSDNENGKSIF